MTVVLVLILSLVFHTLLGWQWTALAGLAVGVWRPRWAALRGGLGVALAWATILLWSFVTAAGPTGEMLGVLGGVLGNMPGSAVVGLTLALAFLVGAMGGLTGGLVRRLLQPPRSTVPVSDTA